MEPWKKTGLAILDIALVYYIFFRLLRLVRGTRAGAVLVGILVVLAGWLAARQLGLVAMGNLLDRFIDSLVIILVVVFQADIRRALARVGGSPRRWGRDGASAGIIPEVVAAAGRLAEQKTGALIVLERGAELTDRLEGAAPVDALVSRSMLISLFQDSSPLHDGAVVLRGDRILVAGYYMPLAMDTQLPSDMGTRHRAAIGLTEDVDAIVLVISEERGEISLAIGGQMLRGLDSEALEALLRAELGVEVERRAWWRSWLKAPGGEHGH